MISHPRNPCFLFLVACLVICPGSASTDTSLYSAPTHPNDISNQQGISAKQGQDGEVNLLRSNVTHGATTNTSKLPAYPELIREAYRMAVPSSRELRKHGPRPIGWVPDKYPNPKRDQEKCHIKSLLDDGSWKSEGGDDTDNHLLLCDPDGVLSETEMQNTATILNDFSNRYGKKDAQERLSSDSDNSENDALDRIHPSIGVALVSTMDLQDILRDFAFYTFEDVDDMVNDAAEYFANFLHKVWWFNGERNLESNGPVLEANGILIFISVQDYVCYISAGNGVTAVLPWWRVMRVVDRMNENLRHDSYFKAVSGAINDISDFLEQGPPSTSEKAKDFFKRFGPVLFFTSSTIFMAVYGERRDRFRKFDEAERVSAMDAEEEDKAKRLQRQYSCKECPICLEPFKFPDKCEEAQAGSNDNDLPLLQTGSDGRPLKLLRCGHVFDSECWKEWIISGSGDMNHCPVCRQGFAKKRRNSLSGSVISDASSQQEDVHETTPLMDNQAGRRSPYDSLAAFANNIILDDEERAAAVLMYI
jgi:hypothetical protein